MSFGGAAIKKQTIEALERASFSLERIVADLYAEVEQAVNEGNYNDASLLQSQAELLYKVVENLETVLAEQEEYRDDG